VVMYKECSRVDECAMGGVVLVSVSYSSPLSLASSAEVEEPVGEGLTRQRRVQ
jgi:hypothetical protein